MKLQITAKRVLMVGAIAFSTGAAVPALSADQVSFAGKRIDVIVPFAPGGGSDVYMRALAPFLEKHLPGKPTIIVRNVPGSRSIPGANQFQERAKPEGTDVMVVSATTVASFVFDRKKVKFEMDKWEPVLLSPQGAISYASPSLGIKSWKDLPKLKGQQLVFGGQSAASGELRFIMTLHLLGFKTNHVWGLNRGPVRLAFERGEFNVNYDSTPGYMGGAIKLVQAGKAVPIFSAGVINEKGELARDPNVPDLPHFGEAYELVHGKKPSGPGYDAWLSVSKMNTMMNKGIFLPAGTPKPVLDAWRKAIGDMLKDPEFDKTAGKVIEGYPQFIGEAAKPIIKDATSFSPESWSWLKNYFKTEHNVTIE
ncbi:MAG: tricarboxylate transporter [Betaproteobacteria bacterium]|nr:MAG: tricarboxylate transporter [Betaproteobacteria bacterium]